MTSIITGDIINSRNIPDQKDWILPLKKLFNTYGKSPKTWEIYRGDSFQIEIKEPGESLMAAIRIKACIKSIKGLDIRMAIGIGEKTYDAPKITESNGSAFINSGDTFESVAKSKKNIAIKSPWPDIDTELNLMIDLASIVMDNWTPSSAELVGLSIQNQMLSQKELGEKIGRTQSSVSERQTRAHYAEISELAYYFKKKIDQQAQLI